MLIVLDMSSGETDCEICSQPEASVNSAALMQQLPRVDLPALMPATLTRPLPHITDIETFLDKMADFH